MPEKPIAPPDERHWWEMQLGMKLRSSAPEDSPAAEPERPQPEKPQHRSFVLSRSTAEHRWWEMQLGKRLRRNLRD